jgi:hypothetical protein
MKNEPPNIEDQKKNLDSFEIINFDEKKYSLTDNQKTEITTQLKKYLQNRPEVRFAFLHGSFLDKLSCRDIDLGVYFDDQLNQEVIFDLALDIAVELTNKLSVPVDVHALNQASNSFCYHVTRGILLTSQDDEETYNFIENTWQFYLDFQPLARQILNDLLQP